MNPPVTIMLCTHNRRRWLRRSLRSALAQDYDNLQVVVVRDGGDPVKDLIQEFNDGNGKKIAFIDRDRNVGYGLSLNE